MRHLLRRGDEQDPVGAVDLLELDLIRSLRAVGRFLPT